MTQGTKSYLFGCHQFFLHPLFVLIAWYCHYKSFPKAWQVVCIFLHDIGICGRQYLENNQKDGHWERGAFVAYKLFGLKGYKFCRGHSDEYENSLNLAIQTPKRTLRSVLFIPDKISFLYAPKFWIRYCQKFEGFDKLCTADSWLNKVRANMAAGFPRDSHEIYMEVRDRQATK